MPVDQIITQLHALADPEKITFKEKKFGVSTHNALGIYMKDLKELAKELPKEAELAQALFDTGIYEARLLCSKIFPPKELTTDLMEKWVAVFDNWEICDSFCMTVFARSVYAVEKIMEWSQREPEFEKRAAFATLAAYCMADKKATNDVFEPFFSILVRESTDDRNFVKKAVNWALRNMGKRNPDLRQQAIKCAYQILELDTKAARWIAKDALKELEKENLRMSDYPRNIYRKST